MPELPDLTHFDDYTVKKIPLGWSEDEQKFAYANFAKNHTDRKHETQEYDTRLAEYPFAFACNYCRVLWLFKRR